MDRVTALGERAGPLVDSNEPQQPTLAIVDVPALPYF